MSQLKKVVEPFGEVNVYPASGGKVRVTATILMEPHRPGTKTGIALDGSGSMGNLYGINSGIATSSIFKKLAAPNAISPVAQQLCAYLAKKIDANHGTNCIYWACGPAGSQIQEIGELTAEQAESHTFGAPKQLGTGTRLLPAVQYFVERHKTAPWGFFVFLTDGELHDLEEVKAYSIGLAKDIAAGRRAPVKLVLIGLGSDVNEQQMEELDDLKTGTDVDLWDHKLASELRVLEQIFAEVVDKNARIASSGRILDNTGKLVKDYSGRGVPAFLEFEVSANAAYFTLEIDGKSVHQGLSDKANVPAGEVVKVGVFSGEQSQSQSQVASFDPQPQPEVTPVTPNRDDSFDIQPSNDMDLGIGLPAKKAPTANTAAQGSFDDLDGLTGGLDISLELNTDLPEIDLQKNDDSQK